VAKSYEEGEKMKKKRMKKNDLVAMCQMGRERYGKGDYNDAIQYWTKTAELGDAEAHFKLSIMYLKGEGVDKDMKKEVYHLEEAAIGGHPAARHNLGIHEANNGRYERAVKHFIIAANLGYDYSLTNLKRLYADGHASKEDYAGALRAYQAAVDATKSEERKKAEEAIKNGSWIRTDDSRYCFCIRG
jgi:TPR repeat protein